MKLIRHLQSPDALFVILAFLLFTTSVIRAQVYEKVFSFTDARAEELANSLNEGSFPYSTLVQGKDGNFYGTTGGSSIDYGTVFRMTPAGALTTLVEFTGKRGSRLGDGPSSLVLGSDGNFYGTTKFGGATDNGTVFRMTPAGKLTTLVKFTGTEGNNMGNMPIATLTQGTDGDFYGTTAGDESHYGTIFKITSAGKMTTLVEFSGTRGKSLGSGPFGALCQGTDGNFYGTTKYGGSSDKGTIFRMSPVGKLTTLVEFTNTKGKTLGAGPSGLVEGIDGNFYGTTEYGGAFDKGTVFKVSHTGKLITMVVFTGINGSNSGALPRAGLFQGIDGIFYGTTKYGGASDKGTVFKMTTGGVFTTLVDFLGDERNNSGSYPVAELAQGSDGNLYGTTKFGGESNAGTVFKMKTTGELTTLVEFAGLGRKEFGSSPYTGLVQGVDGNLCGTTGYGGTFDKGTIFRMTTAGQPSTLVDFTGNSGNNLGGLPSAAPIQGSDGNFYGTTKLGGPSKKGTVYRMTPDGKLTTLVEFSGTSGRNPGMFPVAALVQARDGSFYGTTSGDGSHHGTVFRMTLAGKLSTLVEFTGSSGSNLGSLPAAALIQGDDGNLYGTTKYGGASDSGTVFSLAPSGKLTTLVEFSGTTGKNLGTGPAALVAGLKGNFYGVTEFGGSFDKGTVFMMKPAGKLTTLVEFTGRNGGNPGSNPCATILQGRDGSFYGTTKYGGASDEGTVFRMTLNGVLTTVEEFTNDGRPLGDLILATDGNLYGTTSGTGESDGSIFRILFPGKPLQFTRNPEVLSPARAVIQAGVNARGHITSVNLEYGTDGIHFPNVVAVATDLTGYQTSFLGTTLDGLTPGTVYYYRFHAVNSEGETISPVGSFLTLAEPLVQVDPASKVGPASAQFNATVNPRNFETTVFFEWGINGNNFPNTVPAKPGYVTGNTAVQVNYTVTDLVKGTTYYYRVVASNSAGTVISGTNSFTALTEPIITLDSTEALSTTRARISGTVNTRDSSASVSFEWGTDGIQFANSVSSSPVTVIGSDPVAVTAILTGLQQGTSYFYRIRATGPGGTGLSEIKTFSLSTLSGLVQAFPDPPPSSSGTVTVNFDPSNQGAWRFAGETAWRNSGVAATNLASGRRLIEFLPLAGYISPPFETLDVISGENIVLDRTYFETDAIGSGGLTVHLKPDELAAPGVPEANRAQWRFVGESQWRDSDVPPVSSLTAGSYLVECKPVTGKVTPPTASITITNGSSSELTLTYFTANSTGASTPTPLPFSSVSADEDLPFAYVGQIRSEVGSSTGFVVKRRVVATAGHVVFDDGSLSYVKSMEWLFQRHAGQFEPKPQVPRGSYLATGYATQRITDNSPGQGSAQSQALDYAALYFLEEAGRGGYGGFLATDAGDDNEFLTSTSQKIVAGYAVDGIPAADKGKLHATTAFTAALTPAFGETWTSTAVRGYGGCSGGPLFVRRSNGLYLPAAIYLGGNGQTVVRAIDSAVVDLFLRAEVSGNGGDNNTGGGITLASFTSIGNATQPGALEVTIQPAAARTAGAGWRLKPETSYRSSGSQKSGLSAGNYQLQFPTISGFQAPTQQTVTVTGGQLQTITFTYAAANAAPTIANVANLTIDEDSSTGPISVTVDDPDGPNNALVLTGTSSNTSLIPNGNIVFTGSGGSRSVTITPAANQNGSATITLTVSDGDLTATDTFVVTVDPVNDTPTIANIATQSIPVNTSTGAIPFTIGDIETAASSLTLTRSTSNSTLVPLSGIVFGGSGASPNVTITPAANQIGSANVTVTVSDGVLTASRTFALTVTGTAQESWRFANFGTTENTGNSADNFDADGDGSSNLTEYAAGTNPNSATDVFKILASTKSATTFTVTAAGKASRSYVLERRASLTSGTWITITAVGPLAGDGPVALTDPATPANSAFYRLRATTP